MSGRWDRSQKIDVEWTTAPDMLYNEQRINAECGATRREMLSRAIVPDTGELRIQTKRLNRVGFEPTPEDCRIKNP